MFWLWVLLFTVTNAIQVDIDGQFTECLNEQDKPFSDACTFTDHEVRWGDPEELRSGLGFFGSNNVTLIENESPTVIGRIQHYNWPITGKIPTYILFDLTVHVAETDTNMTMKLQLNETNNQATPLINGTVCPYTECPDWFGQYNATYHPCCPYITTTEPCSDRIRFFEPIDINTTFAVNVSSVTILIDGFFKTNESGSELLESFITEEKQVSEALVFASLVVVCATNDPCPERECYVAECIDPGYCQYTPVCFTMTTTTTSSSSTTGQMVDDDNDEDDTATIAGAVAGSVVFCCCLFLLLGLLGLLGLAVLAALKYPTVPATIQGAARSVFPSTGAQQNPTYNPQHETTTNPVYDLNL